MAEMLGLAVENLAYPGLLGPAGPAGTTALAHAIFTDEVQEYVK